MTIFHYLEHICHPALLAPLTKQRFSIGQWIVVVDLTEVVPLFVKSTGFLDSLIFAPSPNWTMQTVPIRHFGGNFLVWLCIFYVEDTRTHIKYVCGSKYHTVEKGWVAIMADTTIDGIGFMSKLAIILEIF